MTRLQIGLILMTLIWIGGLVLAVYVDQEDNKNPNSRRTFR